MPTALTVDLWYLDVSPVHDGHTFGETQRLKLLAVHDDWVEVTDEFGNRRGVNRLMWEASMTPAEGAMVSEA